MASISDQDEAEIATFLHEAGQLLLSRLRVVNPPAFPTANSQIYRALAVLFTSSEGKNVPDLRGVKRCDLTFL